MKRGRPIKNEYSTDTPFSARLREIMLSKDVSVKDAAAAVHMSRSTVSQWRRGMTEPSIDALRRLCKLLDVSADYLLDIKNIL